MNVHHKDTGSDNFIVIDPSVMSGEPVLRGTRVPAATIVVYLQSGHSPADIFQDFPTLPDNAIEAVEAWASTTYGKDWMTAR